MMKPTIPQGMRDFEGAVLHKRNYIFKVIKKQFELFGFTPLETPAMENIQTLMGKYGDEGDQLLFKVLNNGLHVESKRVQSEQGFQNVLKGKTAASITERALRYDLTIPFARYVATHFNTLTMPFKRYQVQPVWRADRPQRGRYREFYQCDADMVGSHALLNEIELLQLAIQVFTELNLSVVLKINHRKIFDALFETWGLSLPMTIIVSEIDKLDKIGWPQLRQNLELLALSPSEITKIENLIELNQSDQKIALLKQILQQNPKGMAAIHDLEIIEQTLQQFISPQPFIKIELDFTLARGLSYYTDTIFEIKSVHTKIGSIAGGGRYNNLTELFGLSNVNGVGISFGVDRIYDVMEEEELFPDQLLLTTRVLFFNLGHKEVLHCLPLTMQLRRAGVSCEVYPDAVKMDKQFKYAERKGINFVILIGTQEIDNQQLKIKNLTDRTEQTVRFIDFKGPDLARFF